MAKNPYVAPTKGQPPKQPPQPWTNPRVKSGGGTGTPVTPSPVGTPKPPAGKVK